MKGIIFEGNTKASTKQCVNVESGGKKQCIVLGVRVEGRKA